VGCTRVAAAIGFDFVRDRMLHFVVRGQWLAGGSAGAVQAAVRGSAKRKPHLKRFVSKQRATEVALCLFSQIACWSSITNLC
jgi:hypothetical protein